MPSSPGIQFEDEIREFLHRLGFQDVPGYGPNRIPLTIGGQEIDAFGRFGSLYIIVDAKISTTSSTSAQGSQSQMTLMTGYRPRVNEAIRACNQQHGFRKSVFIFWTKGKKLTTRQINFAHKNNIALRDEVDLKYYKNALDLLENPKLVRNSFLKDISYQITGDVFETRPAIQVPAIETVIGTKKFYTFQLQADNLLDFSYVFRLETNNLNLLYSYQRLLKPKKIREIREYLRNGGFFANNILMVSDEELPFSPDRNQAPGSTPMYGMLSLPNKPCYLEIIDGQHRLMAYSNLESLSSQCLGATIITNMDRRERARAFVTVNREQTRVKKNLLWLLYPKIDPGSLEAKISNLVQKINKNGPLKDYILIPGVRSPVAYLSFTQICNTFYDRTNLVRKYGSNAAFINLINAYISNIKAGNTLLLDDWELSTSKKARKGFLFSNTCISILFYLLGMILDKRREERIAFPTTENIPEWVEYIDREIVPAFTRYLNDNRNTESTDDPFGYLRSLTKNSDRRDAARSIFNFLTSYS